jgi:hypothetical protein
VNQHQPWTPEHDAILTEMYRRGKISTQLHLLPGRTLRACIMRAQRIGVSMTGPSTWTKAEDQAIRRGYKHGIPLKEIAAELDGRSPRAICARAIRLGLNGKFAGKTGSTFSWIEMAARKALEDGIPLTARALIAATGASNPGMVHLLRRVHGKGFYIANWENCGHTYAAMWALGDEPDAERPAKKTAADSCRAWRARQKLKVGAGNPFATLILQVAA